MADQRGARRKKKKESTAEILAGLSRLIDQTAAKKTKKGPTVVEFQRDPVTCRRVYKSKYQPRPQGLLAFQYGGGSGEDPGTQQNHVTKISNDGNVFKMAAKAK